MKKILTLLGISLSIFFLSGCNRQMIDVTYTYHTAIIYLPDGEIVKGAVQSWKDYADGDQIQVKINDTVYLVHSNNIALRGGEKENEQ